jgi:hypothetical protein
MAVGRWGATALPSSAPGVRETTSPLLGSELWLLFSLPGIDP